MNIPTNTRRLGEKHTVNNYQIYYTIMKKSQLISLLYTFFILFLTVGCENNEELESSVTQVLVKSRSVSTSVCKVKMNILTKPYFNYKFNGEDNIDVCYIAIDDQEFPDYGSLLKVNETVLNVNYMSPGRHRIKLKVKIDDGCAYDYPCKSCGIEVISKEGDSSIRLFYKNAKREPLIYSVTNAIFLADFYINVPYTDEYNLDVNLALYDETGDDGTIAPPYIAGNISFYTYNQWGDNLQVPDGFQYILGILYDNPDETEFIYEGACMYSTENIYGIIRNIGRFDTVKLPGADDVGYKMYLITRANAEFGSGTQLLEGYVSWYSAFYREKNHDGTYTEWYSVDELSTSTIPCLWIDATIDFYSNLEIVCFDSKETQDAYASSWGIDPNE